MEKIEGNWVEVFGLGSRGPSIDIDRNKMVRIPGHTFLKF